MMEVYAVFRRPKNAEGYLEEPIAVFSNEAAAELTASRLSMGSGDPYLVGRYYVLEETNVPAVPIVAAEGTISFFKGNGGLAPTPDFQITSCKRKDDGVASIDVDHVPAVHTDPYGNRVAIYSWKAVVDVLETDTIDSIKQRLLDYVERHCRSLMGIMDPFESTTK